MIQIMMHDKTYKKADKIYSLNSEIKNKQSWLHVALY